MDSRVKIESEKSFVNGEINNPRFADELGLDGSSSIQCCDN